MIKGKKVAAALPQSKQKVLYILYMTIFFSGIVSTSLWLALNHVKKNYYFGYENMYMENLFSLPDYNITIPEKSWCLERNFKMMSANFEINPEAANISRVLIIGEYNSLQWELINLFKQNGIPHLEVRSKLHFDLSVAEVYQILEQVNISLIIDTRHDYYEPLLHKYARIKNLRILSIVSELNNESYNQIEIPRVWGHEVLNINSTYPMKALWECMSLGHIGEEIKSDEKIIYAKDAAKFVFKVAKLMLEGKNDYPNSFRTTEMINVDDFYYLLFKKFPKCFDYQKEKRHIPYVVRSQFNYVVKETKMDRKRNSPIYASYVVAVSSNAKILDRFQMALQAFGNLNELFPDVKIEFIVVFCRENNDDKKFSEYVDIPKNLNLKIIDVPFTHLQDFKDSFNITYFPEFSMKNIGIRRANGEYIISANADSTPPLTFFEAIQKRAFTPLSYTRTVRFNYKAPNSDAIVKRVLQSVVKPEQHVADVCVESRFYDKFYRPAGGDFQCGHRFLWNMVRGFVETEHVFHVDTMLSMDFAAIPTNLHVRMIGENVHYQHPKTSTKTAHFKFYDPRIKTLVRHSIFSHTDEPDDRYNWGSGNVTFKIYKAM